MICRKRIKAGVMLYALLMMAVFALLLQFYLNRQVARARIHQAGRDSLTAYAMAVWTKDKVERKQSEASHSSGSTSSQENSSEGLENDKTSTNKTESTSSSSAAASSSETVQSDQRFPASAENSQEKANKGSTDQDQPSLEAKQKAEQSTSSSSEKAVKKTDNGQISFKEGQAVYQQEASKLIVDITLSGGAEFHYQFSMTSPNG